MIQNEEIRMFYKVTLVTYCNLFAIKLFGSK